MSAAEPRYYPTYRETEDTTESWHDWLVFVQSGETEPSELSTITDVCASARVKATLYDEHGFVRGHVDADGNYGLS